MSKVTEKSLQDVTEQALQAAQLATEAAHEAEAAITARHEAAMALNKTAKQTRILALGAAGLAVVMFGLGGVLWARASSNLSENAEVQASATASFVENLMMMNDTLTKLEAVVDRSEQNVEKTEAALDVVIARLDQRLESLLQEMGEKLTTAELDAPQSNALLMALAEVELNLTRQLAELSLAPRAAVPAQAPAGPQVATTPAPTKAPAPRSAPRATSARTSPPPPNPFRFP